MGQTALWGSCPFMLYIFCDRRPEPAARSGLSVPRRLFHYILCYIPPICACTGKGLKSRRKCSTIRVSEPKWRNGRRRRLKISRFCTVPVRVRSSAPARRKRHIAYDELFHFIAKLIAHSFCCSSLPNRTRFAGLRFGFLNAHGHLFYQHNPCRSKACFAPIFFCLQPQ